MGEGRPLPAFTRLVLGVSRAVKDNILVSTGIVIAFVILLNLFIRTNLARHAWDKFKLKMPAVGRS